LRLTDAEVLMRCRKALVTYLAPAPGM
jgi:hypothetical protein